MQSKWINFSFFKAANFHFPDGTTTVQQRC